MLIKPPFIKCPDLINDEDNSILRFNVIKGEVSQVRNSVYIRKLEIDTVGNEIYDVVLVSDMLKRFKLYDYYDKFVWVKERQRNPSLMYELDDMYVNVFCRLTHIFNGVYRDNPALDFKDKLGKICLYPSISCSIGKPDYADTKDKALYIKHGTGTVSSVIYDHNTYEGERIICHAENIQKAFKELEDISHLDNNVFIDIPDPKYPDMQPYAVGEEYPRCLEFKSHYYMKEILSSLTDVSVNVVSDYANDVTMMERRNAMLRKKLMCEDADSDISAFNAVITLRMLARNIAVDFTEISICSAFDKLELMYDSCDTTNPSVIKNITIPFDKFPGAYMMNTLNKAVYTFKNICLSNLRPLIQDGIGLDHIRVSICDTQYETLVKVTDFTRNNITESVRLNKSECVHDYLLEGLYHNSSGNIVRTYPTDRLTNNVSETNKNIN